jgi:hypothetical protein
MKILQSALIIKSDLSFSIVENEHFKDYATYLKSDISIPSRRTIMRRIEEMYIQKKQELKERLNRFNDHFLSSFEHYERKLSCSSEFAPCIAFYTRKRHSWVSFAFVEVQTSKS